MLPIINLSFFLLLLGLLPAATQAASLLLRVRGLIPTESCSLQGLRLGRQLPPTYKPLAVALKQKTRLTTGPPRRRQPSSSRPPHAALLLRPATAAALQSRTTFSLKNVPLRALGHCRRHCQEALLAVVRGRTSATTSRFSTISGDTGLTAIVQIQNPEEECRSPNGGAEGKLEDAEVIGKTAKFSADLFSAFRG